MIDQRFRDGERIFADFILNPVTILANVFRPDRAAVLEVQGFSGCERAGRRNEAQEQYGLGAHYLEV